MKTLFVVISAVDLKDVNLSANMGVYAFVSILGDPLDSQVQRTPVYIDGEPNPTWIYLTQFHVNEEALQQDYLMLKFDIKSGQKDIGEVHISIKDLFDQKAGQQLKDVRFTVQTPSGEAKGTLEFNYIFGDKFAAAAPGHMAARGSTVYPASLLPHGEAGNAQPAYRYPYPPPGGYPAPPPQNGYWSQGYPPPPQQHGYPGHGWYPQQQVVMPPQQPVVMPPNRSGGLLAKVLKAEVIARLLIGDMTGDIGGAARYDAGYDDDFDAGDLF